MQKRVSVGVRVRTFFGVRVRARKMQLIDQDEAARSAQVSVRARSFS